MPWEGYGEATPNAEAQGVSDLPGMAPFEGEQVKTRDLLGKTFTIYKVRRMASNKRKGTHFYAIQAVESGSGKLFNSLLGGVAVVKVIDTWLHQSNRRPLTVSLEEVQGGEFGRYYILK
jgi:hypothetical protein